MDWLFPLNCIKKKRILRDDFEFLRRDSSLFQKTYGFVLDIGIIMSEGFI